MQRYIKKVVLTPKISAVGILLNTILILIPLIGIGIVWSYMEESAFKEACKILLAVIDAIIILHLVHRLVLNKVWFDINDPDYQTEYIELYPDRIVIYDRAHTYSGHHYNYGIIYFQDIKYTFINGKTPKSVYKLKIIMNRPDSGKSVIKNYDGATGIIFANMEGYPEELNCLLLKDYKAIMKVR